MATAVIGAALLATTLIGGGPSQVAALKASGIYLTADDYKSGRLTDKGDCAASDHRLELHDVLKKPYVHITHGSETKRYEKTEIFGFRACSGSDFRFVGNLDYQILESKDIYVYFIKVPMPAATGARATWRKSEYHFSVGPEGALRLLTLDNLKHAFPNNHKFHDGLDQLFRADQDLAQYDTFHKMFKINRLLIASSEH
jgi:hypothetical protein